MEPEYRSRQARLPVLTSMAWSSPKKAAFVSTEKWRSGTATPVHHCPGTRSSTLPSSVLQWFSLDGMRLRLAALQPDIRHVERRVDEPHPELDELRIFRVKHEVRNRARRRAAMPTV